MTRGRRTPAVLLALTPWPAAAHDAFGDLGPFYANLLHPLADPAQAVLLAGFAVLLARQPLESVRIGYAALAIAGTFTVLCALVLGVSPPSLLAVGLLATALGVCALPKWRTPRVAIVALGVAVAVLAGLGVERASGLRPGILTVLGAAIGLGVATLLLWASFDLLRRRIGEIACAVAGSWVAAIGIMTAVLPR